MSKPSTKKKLTAELVEDDWDQLVERLGQETQRAKSRQALGKTLSRYDAPEGIRRRLTYGFVRKYQRKTDKGLLEALLNQKLDEANKRKKGKKYAGRFHHNAASFGDNPFTHTLKAIEAVTGEVMVSSVRSRLGRAMLYADRHKIEPELLVGFLCQTGSLQEIAEKSEDERALEDWRYKQVGRDPHAPLVVIDFDGTEQSLDGFPVRMARAKVKNPTHYARTSRTLIKPDPSWSIDDNWYAVRGREIGVTKNDLLRARTAREVLEPLIVATSNVPTVYCYDMRLCSHFLDILTVAAELPVDFTLRDVGDYLDHDVDKRIALREEIKDSQSSPDAFVRARELCDALSDLGNDS